MNKAQKIIDQLVSLRENIGNSPLTKVASAVDKALEKAGITYEIVGGYAVQFYGYVRTTQDLDVVVDDLNLARSALLSTDLFKTVQGNPKQLRHRKTGVEIDLLAAGTRASPTSLPYPFPRQGQKYASLPTLISLKLGSGRIKDQADVVELIKINGLPPDYGVNRQVAEKYGRLWKAAQSEQET